MLDDAFPKAVETEEEFDMLGALAEDAAEDFWNGEDELAVRDLVADMR